MRQDFVERAPSSDGLKSYGFSQKLFAFSKRTFMFTKKLV